MIDPGWALLGAAALHIGEEYVWPGGFLGSLRRFLPASADAISPAFAAVTNAVFLALVLAGALVGPAIPVIALSAAAVVLANTVAHVAMSVRLRGYAPGVLTALVLYLPIGLWTYWAYAEAGRLDPVAVAASAAAGALLQVAPLASLRHR